MSFLDLGIDVTQFTNLQKAHTCSVQDCKHLSNRFDMALFVFIWVETMFPLSGYISWRKTRCILKDLKKSSLKRPLCAVLTLLVNKPEVCSSLAVEGWAPARFDLFSKFLPNVWSQSQDFHPRKSLKWSSLVSSSPSFSKTVELPRGQVAILARSVWSEFGRTFLKMERTRMYPARSATISADLQRGAN